MVVTWVMAVEGRKESDGKEEQKRKGGREPREGVTERDGMDKGSKKRNG
jgi:hypothetical protein